MVLNKLRLIKIYELRGKIHPIEASIIDLLDSIEEVLEHNTIHYKITKYYFSYNTKSNSIWLFYPIIQMFNCTKKETQEIMKYLLEKHLKLKIDEVW